MHIKLALRLKKKNLKNRKKNFKCDFSNDKIFDMIQSCMDERTERCELL